MASPIVFRSTDSDAPTLSGTAGDLLTMLNGLLTIKRQFTGISGGSFVDNTTEAQSNDPGQTAFKLFQGPTQSNDEAYFGLPAKFDRITFGFGTPGVQNATITLAWEYWNGSAWTALTVVDGTSKLTQNGKVTFTIPSDWATKSVNSVTCYWVRVRFTAGSWTTNPLVNYITLTGWTKPFVDSGNKGAFQQGGGNSIYLSINDAAPGTARDARPLGYETMSAIQTGTGPFPTAEASTMAWRKSATADATTRAWLLIADDRTVYYFVKAGDTNTPYRFHGFGDFYSLIPGDAYRSILFGNNAETAGSLAASNALGQQFSGNLSNTLAAHWLDRAYTGFGSATACAKNPYMIGAASGGFNTDFSAPNPRCAFPNAADGGIILSPVMITETLPLLRGRLRGIYYQQHVVTNYADGDTFAGSNAYAGRSFLAVLWGNDTDTINKVVIVETSDTWDTN